MIKTKSITVFFVLAAILFLFSNEVKAQCCAAGNPITGDAGPTGGKGILTAGLFYKHSYSDTYFEEREPVDYIHKNTVFNFSMLSLNYGLTEKMNLRTEVGYFINKSEYLVNYDYWRKAYGLGDATITISYRAYKNEDLRLTITPLLTFKAPIGQFDQMFDNVVLPIDLQPSSGSFRYNPSLSVFRGFKGGRFSMFSLISIEFAQAIKTRRTINYKYGNLYLLSLVASYEIRPWMSASVQVRDQIREKANNNGLILHATGGNIMFVVPQVTVNYKGWVLGCMLDYPIYRNLNSVGYPQLANKYAISFNLTRSFNLKKKAETPFKNESPPKE